MEFYSKLNFDTQCNEISLGLWTIGKRFNQIECFLIFSAVGIWGGKFEF